MKMSTMKARHKTTMIIHTKLKMSIDPPWPIKVSTNLLKQWANCPTTTLIIHYYYYVKRFCGFCKHNTLFKNNSFFIGYSPILKMEMILIIKIKLSTIFQLGQSPMKKLNIL